MGCTAGQFATSCDNPPKGFNWKGIQESIDNEGNYTTSSRSGNLWKGQAQSEQIERYPFVFPPLNPKNNLVSDTIHVGMDRISVGCHS
jgi:hypothetical protein